MTLQFHQTMPLPRKVTVQNPSKSRKNGHKRPRKVTIQINATSPNSAPAMKTTLQPQKILRLPKPNISPNIAPAMTSDHVTAPNTLPAMQLHLPRKKRSQNHCNFTKYCTKTSQVTLSPHHILHLPPKMPTKTTPMSPNLAPATEK